LGCTYLIDVTWVSNFFEREMFGCILSFYFNSTIVYMD